MDRRARCRAAVHRRLAAATDSADSGPGHAVPRDGASDESPCRSRSSSGADSDPGETAPVRCLGRPPGSRFARSVLVAAASRLVISAPPSQTPQSRGNILRRARAALAEKASRERALPADSLTTDALPAPPRKKLSEAELKALKFLLYSPSAGGAAAAFVAATTGLDRRRLPTLHEVSAQLLLEQDEKALIDTLMEVRRMQSEGLIEALQFCWFRAYDETPEKFRTFSTEDGVPVSDATVAKVLAAQRSWSMLLRLTAAGRAAAGQAAAGPGRAAAGPGVAWEDELSRVAAGRAATDRVAARLAALAQADDPDVAGDFIELHGTVATSLIPVSNATAGVMLAATRRVSWLPPVAQALIESTFRRRSLWSTADMHASNGRVERAMAYLQSSWQCCHIRCGIHRASSCELKAQDVCSETVSGVLNLTLAFRAPGMASRFRRLLCAHLRKTGNVKRLVGMPSTIATAHREAVYGLFSRHPGAASKRRVAVVSRLANADIRKSVVEHYCNLNCCPRGLSETVEKMCKYLASGLGL